MTQKRHQQTKDQHVHQEKRGIFLKWMEHIVSHKLFTATVTTLIFLNAITVGLETYPAVYTPFQAWFHMIDGFFVWIFTLEIVLRIYVSRPWYRFFGNGWNLFDFAIIACSHLFAGSHFITVLRILRILRILRAISVIPSLQLLVNALLRTIPTLGNIMLLLGLIFYIFAVMGTVLFSQTSPEYFGTLHQSLFTLFQVVTLESWASAIARPIIYEVPWAWIYFTAFVLVGTFVIMNLFVGVIVNNVQNMDILQKQERNAVHHDEEERDDREEANEISNTLTHTQTSPSFFEEDVVALREEIRELKQLIVDMQSDTGHSNKNDQSK